MDSVHVRVNVCLWCVACFLVCLRFELDRVGIGHHQCGWNGWNVYEFRHLGLGGRHVCVNACVVCGVSVAIFVLRWES